MKQLSRPTSWIVIVILAVMAPGVVASAAPAVCPRCVFEPLAVVHDGRGPTLARLRFSADPNSHYALLAAESSFPGGQVEVVLNGARVLTSGAFAKEKGSAARVDVTLASLNEIAVTVNGRPGGAVTVWIESKPPVLEDCGDAMTWFNALPTPVDQLRSIVPLGSVSPPQHTLPIHHLNPYARVTDPSNPVSDPIEAQVFAPGRATLVAISHGIESDGHEDFTLHLKPCQQVQMYLIHLNALVPGLEARAGDLSSGVCSPGGCAKLLDLAIVSGELLGTAARPGFFGYDIGLIDTRRGPLPFANPSRYELSSIASIPPELEEFAETVTPDRLHQFCALDYFTPERRTELASLLGSFDGAVRRTAPPQCGEHMQDLVGTAQGNWFLNATSSAFFEDDETLALVHDKVNPAIPEFSVSNAIPNWTAGERFFSPAFTGRVNRDFALVLEGTTYCYQGLTLRGGVVEAGVVLVAVFSEGSGTGNAIRIERKPAALSCAALGALWTFSENAVVFRR
jgi:hypothetical protein